MHSALYLASQSPRRRELLHQIGVQHDTLRPQVPEVREPNETPEDYVYRLSREKAQAGWQLVIEGGLAHRPVLGADTIGIIDEDVLEKPLNQEDATAMLKRLSGRAHQVVTAVSLAYEDDIDTRVSVTNVHFRELSESEITEYWLTGEPVDKAGSYAIQGLGAVFVARLEGSYSGVVGLPIESTIDLLKAFSVRWWQPKECFS